jgi:hypothetical protein
MSSDIAALAPPAAASRPDPADMVRPDVPEIPFDALWSDKKKGFTFSDLLDIVNPLQHLPVIGTIYRAVTGDEISLGARIVGGALYGGPVGVMGEAALAAADQAVGGDAGGKFLAFVGDLFGGDGDSATQLAKVEPAAGAADAAAPAPDTSKADKSKIVKSIGDAAADPNAVIAAPAAAPVLVPAGRETSSPTAAAPAAAAPAVTQPLRDFPALPRPRQSSSRGVMMPLRPGLGGEQMMPLRPGFGAQGGGRMMPLVPGVPGAAGGAQPAAQSAAGPRADAMPADEKPADGESKRIADQIAAAQRAQTGLLLARLAGSPTTPAHGHAGDDSRGKDSNPADPFKSHAMPPPPGASATWISRAMEQALTRYQRSQQLQPGSSGSAAKDPAAGAASSNAAAAPADR